MNHSRDVYNRKHMKNIRQKVEQGTGMALNRHAPRSAAHAGIVFAVFAACVLFGTSALAMGVPEVNGLLYYVLPEAAQFFKPVQKSSVDQGIEVKVESAYIHGAEAEAVVSVRDLTGNRLDKSIDFDDSYDFQTGFDSFGTCSQIGYDEATKTAYFQLSMSSMKPNDRILGSKITFSLKTLICGKEEVLAKPISMDWLTIPETVKTESADPYEETVLMPGDDQMEPESGFYLSGIGYVDEKLHIQLFTPWRSVYDDHAFLYLSDAQGNRVYADMLYRGGYNTGAEETVQRADYIDYAFDVPQSELEQYSLFGDFYSAKTRIDGNWSITPPIEDAK